MKIVIFVTALVLLASCAVLPEHKYASINERVGWLHGNCLAIKNPNIELPKNMTLFDFKSEKRFSTATVTEKVQSGDECYALLDDRKEVNLASGYSFYKVKSESPVNLAIGYLNISNVDNLVFNYCTTTEGILFSISKSKLNIWEGYYYLGYESEATCN